jgi:CRISPR-associated protein Cas2
MAREAVWVYAYDIAADRIRRRVAAVLEEHGTRVQESVFEVHGSEAQAGRLLARLEALIDGGDRLRMYCLNADGRRRSRAVGGTPLPEETEFWLL